MKEDANLAISDGDRLSTGDELDVMCEYLPSQYVLDAFFSVSGERERGASKTAELRSEEMEPAGVKSDASRKD